MVVATVSVIPLAADRSGMMCVHVDFAGTDNRFYSSHSKGHVFSSHPAPHRKFKYASWFAHKYIN